jgi:hypothetical protein
MNRNAKNHSASLLEHALKTSLEKSIHKKARRRTPEDVHAQLILIIGSTLGSGFFDRNRWNYLCANFCHPANWQSSTKRRSLY